LIGDALGGPVEFQPPEKVHALPDGPKAWREGEALDQSQLAAAARRFRLRPYSPLRPRPEPYAHWAADAPPGTVTDDSRHKMILLHALRTQEATGGGALTEQDLARAYLSWLDSPAIAARQDYRKIGREWLAEMQLAARWTLGERDESRALPTERLWVGLPTCCGQMTLPPLAAIYAGDPESAYRAAFSCAFFDNGWGKDLNAALVAGLAAALVLPAAEVKADPAKAWSEIVRAMRTADPYRHRDVPWSTRSVDRWLDVASRVVKASQGEPARLFKLLGAEFRETTKWEAQVPFVVTFAAAELCRYDPLAALELSIEWGEDTDSYAQLLGAFVGALHGPEVFPEAARRAVAERLKADYGEEVSEWVAVLGRNREG
jgi:ADP-ribosylglycohydrolase